MTDWSVDYTDDASNGSATTNAIWIALATMPPPPHSRSECHRWRDGTDRTICGVATVFSVWTQPNGGCPACVAIAFLEKEMAGLLPRHPLAWLQTRQRILGIRRATRAKQVSPPGW